MNFWPIVKLTSDFALTSPQPSCVSNHFVFSRKTMSWRRWSGSGQLQWFKQRCARRATSDVPSRESTWRSGTQGALPALYSDLVLIWKAYAHLEAWTSCWKRSKPWAAATTRTLWSTTPASSSGMNSGWFSGCSRWEDFGRFKWNNSSYIELTCSGGKPAGHNQAQNEDCRL